MPIEASAQLISLALLLITVSALQLMPEILKCTLQSNFLSWILLRISQIMYRGYQATNCHNQGFYVKKKLSAINLSFDNYSAISLIDIIHQNDIIQAHPFQIGCRISCRPRDRRLIFVGKHNYISLF